jgi:hypothetical protein
MSRSARIPVFELVQYMQGNNKLSNKKSSSGSNQNGVAPKVGNDNRAWIVLARRHRMDTRVYDSGSKIPWLLRGVGKAVVATRMIPAYIAAAASDTTQGQRRKATQNGKPLF